MCQIIPAAVTSHDYPMTLTGADVETLSTIPSWSGSGHERTCRPLPWHGASYSITGRNRGSAANGRSVPTADVRVLILSVSRSSRGRSVAHRYELRPKAV